MPRPPPPAPSNRTPRRGPPPLPRGYRAKDWALDPVTGEYARVTFRSRHGQLISTESYQERGTAHLKAIRNSRSMLMGLIAVGVGVLVLELMSSNGGPQWAAGAGFFLTIFGWPALVILAVGWLMSFGTIASAAAKVGPPPVVINQGQEVDEQRVHDTSGFMDAAELRAALKGQVQEKPQEYDF